MCVSNGDVQNQRNTFFLL